MKVIVKERVYLSGFDEQLYEKLKTRLTLENPAYSDEYDRLSKAPNIRRISDVKKQEKVILKSIAVPKYIKAFEELDTGLSIPRGTLDLIPKDKVKVSDQTSLGEGVHVESKVALRDYQVSLVKNAMETTMGVLVASPGSGKTVVGIDIICKRGRKALWITHKSSLASQAIERIQEFTNLDKKDIGFIGGGKFEVGDITVALVQTLFRRDLESDFLKQFGTVVFDECHRLPASSMYQTLTLFPSRYLYGLSATPYRRDRLEPLMFFALGKTIGRVEKETLIRAGQIIPATVIQKRTGVSLPDIPNYSWLIKKLFDNKKRLRIIVGDVIAEATMGNICVVLCTKVAYAKAIVEGIKLAGVSVGLVYSAETKTVRKKTVVVSSMKAKERKEIFQQFFSGNLSVLIATYSALSEGFDHRPINRLFLTSPISHENPTLIEQTCGRVERPFPGKKDALVYDYVDSHPLFEHQAENRVPIYEENLMSVTFQ